MVSVDSTVGVTCGILPHTGVGWFCQPLHGSPVVLSCLVQPMMIQLLPSEVTTGQGLDNY